jgi:WD40 repeat protein
MDARWAAVCLALALTLPQSAGAYPPAAAPNPEGPPLDLGKGDRVIVRGGLGICGVGFSLDGKLLATGGDDRVIHLWDVETGAEVRRLESAPGFIRTVAFSPDGTQLASAGDGDEVLLWDVATGEELRRIGQHRNGLRLAAFSPDGKTLVSSDFDTHIGLWDVATGKQLHFWQAHTRVPYSVAFSPDGKMLASGGDVEGSIRLWDVATAKQLRSWEAHKGCVYSVEFSPDGRLLASGGGDTTAKLWEVATGKEVRRLEGHSEAVSKVAFAPDGRTLLTASHVQTVHLWETMTGKEIRRFGKHDGWVWGVAYSPTGRAVASAGKDGAAVIWALDGAAARQTRTADLTAKELDGAWRDLASTEGARSFDAAILLSSGAARQVVPYLRERLRPATRPTVEPDRLARLVRDLDDDTFEVRERATKELEELGEAASPALRKALAGQPTVEARRRLEELLEKVSARELPPERLRSVRALRVLEDLDNPDTRKLLKELAGGAADDPLTLEAAAVLARLARRVPAAP